MCGIVAWLAPENSAPLNAASNTLKRLSKNFHTANPVEIVADKGYFAKEIIKNLSKARRITRISEPVRTLWYSWNDAFEARKAVYANRAQLKSGIGKATMRKRGELVERSFQHVLDRGGQRRTHVRDIVKVQKNYFLEVAGFNLGLLMRSMLGYGTPKGLADGLLLCISCARNDANLLLSFFCAPNNENNRADSRDKCYTLMVE